MKKLVLSKVSDQENNFYFFIIIILFFFLNVISGLSRHLPVSNRILEKGVKYIQS